MSHAKYPFKRIAFLIIAVFHAILVLTCFHQALAGNVENAKQGIIYFDIALDETRQRIYGTDEANNQLHVIDMDTLGVVMTIPIGTLDGPTGLDISPNGQELAVAVPDPHQIVFFDLDTLSITGVVTPNFGVLPYDVVYGRPGRLYSAGRNGTGIEVIDTISKTVIGGIYGQFFSTNPKFAITADNNTLYVGRVNGTPQRIYRLDISTDTISETGQTPGPSVRVDDIAVTPDGSKLFTSRGQIWNGALTTVLGDITIFREQIEYSDTRQMFYITDGDRINEYDANDYSFIRFYPVSAEAGVAKLNTAEDTIYVSTENGIEKVPLKDPNFLANLYLPAILKP